MGLIFGILFGAGLIGAVIWFSLRGAGDRGGSSKSLGWNDTNFNAGLDPTDPNNDG